MPDDNVATRDPVSLRIFSVADAEAAVMIDISGESGSSGADAFDAAATARGILRRALTGSLATTESAGSPFVTLVTLATSMAGTPVLLISKLARHTSNLERDPRAALLIVAPGGEHGDPLSGARLTVSGRVNGPANDPDLARRFLARHPEATSYAGFKDFGFYRLEIEEGHLVAGFGRIVSLAAGDLIVDLGGAEALAKAEAEAVAHMNEEHRDALRLYAVNICGAPDGEWRATGLDPRGLDLVSAEGKVARLDFPSEVATPQALRSVLAALAGEARAASSG